MTDYTKTTNFLAKDSLPDSDTAKIIRGSEFDTEFNSLVTAVASKANTLSPVLTGTPVAPTATASTNTTQLATTAYVTTAVAASFPTGGIIIWSGAEAAIPTGWILCNGSGGSPDLRDRFIVGAGTTYAVGGTGGSANSVAVNHTHTGSVTDPGHAHDILYQSTVAGGSYGSSTTGTSSGTTTDSNTTGISITVNPLTGEDGTNRNLPPYYALCYIYKT
jgi:hypothetical protein|tara:strand:+ start:2770 stop:3426 length:657 start_codon:yes stop_codon:yes gene_type:complete